MVIRNKRVKSLLVFLLSFCVMYGGKETQNNRLNSTQMQATGASLIVVDNKFTGSPTWISGFVNAGNSVKIELGLNEDLHVFHATYFKTEVTFDVQLMDDVLGITTLTNQKLTIYYQPTSGAYKDKAQLNFNGYYRVLVSNIVVKTYDTPTNTNLIGNPSDIYLEGEIVTDRIYNFSPGITAIPSGDYNYFAPTSDNEMIVYWNFVTGAEEYELEWTYVDDYAGSAVGVYKALGTDKIPYDLEHDATRIITSNNYYRIPLTYEHGYIVYRLRPIGRSPITIRADGQWTNPISSQDVSALSGTEYYHITGALGLDKFNWSSTKTFAEYGKQGVGVNYMDGLAFTHQSIARLNTVGKSIVQSTLYDDFGRPSISVLPSPVQSLNFGFINNLNKTYVGANSVLFDKRIFDLCSNNSCSGGNSIVLDSLNSIGAANYYSALNPNTEGQQAYVPTALGIPYTQIKYNNDPLGRISEQTLPGSMHTLNSGKSILYFYSKPSQVELDRLFGSEVGSALHFEKHFMKDPNGQYSTSYIDMYGRTVATALIGDAPISLDQIPDMNPSVRLTDDLISVNQLSNDCYEVNSSFFVTYVGEQQTFTYTTNIAAFIPSECSNLCLDCEYDLYISVKDDCGNEVFQNNLFNNNNPAVPYVDDIGASSPYISNCPGVTSSDVDYTNTHKFTMNSANTSNVLIVFPHPGVYNIQKKICVSDKPVNDYLNLYLNNNPACVKSLCNFIDSLTNRTSFSPCSLDCSSCVSPLNNYNTARINNQNDSLQSTPYYPPLSSGEVNQATTNCQNILCGGSLCNAYKAQLMADFNPGGLYGETNPLNVTAYGFSIFNSSNVNLGGYSWSSPPNPLGLTGNLFKDGSGNPALVNILGTNYQPNNLTQAQVISNWQNSWAETFLPLHPDYCKMKFYCEFVNASAEYDKQMKKIDYYDDACSQGFTLPYLPSANFFSSYPPSPLCGTANLDPLFTSTDPTLVAVLAPLLAGFNASMSNYIATNSPSQNIYQIASEQVVGATLPTGYTFGKDICWQDLEWRKFRDLYQALKNQLYTNLITGYLNYNNGHLCSPLVQITDPNFLPNHINTTDPATAINTQFSVTAATTGTAALAMATASLQANCATACSSYVDLWIQNIKSCGYNSLSPADTIKLRADLIAVCEKGCDSSHPWGSTNYPTGGNPTAYTIPGGPVVYSFQDVLNYYFPPPVGKTFACDANLITMPSPYNVNNTGTNASGALSTVFLDDCGCNKILQVNYDFANSINVPAGITSARKLFNYRYNTELKNFNLDLCACQGALTNPGSWTPGYTWTAGELAVLFKDSVSVDPVLKCNSCISCAQLESVITSMSTNYSFNTSNTANVITFINNNQQVALNNFNNAFNVTNTLQDYIKLLQDCRQFNAPLTQYTFSNSITPEASALQLYLNDLAQHHLLSSSHNMTLCNDEKFYMSNLYMGPLPGIGNNYYNAIISGNNLTIELKATPTSLTPFCTITLTLPGGPLTWNNINSVTGIMAYVPVPTVGPQYGFLVNVSNGISNGTATGSSTCYKICTLGSSPPGPQLCPKEKTTIPNQCEKNIMAGIIGQAKTLYLQYLAAITANFKERYEDSCLVGLHESFKREYGLVEYHYTLYYYDQAGNLTRSVAPKGVQPLSITTPIGTGPLQYPVHSSLNAVGTSYVNLYQFNSYNEPAFESTVDGGQTNYFYDLIGRIVASQNAKQSANNAYSYTFYDAFGRIKEIGEVSNPTNNSGVLTENIAENTFAAFVNSGTRNQVTQTFYDIPLNVAAPFVSGQNNLRNRVAAVTYEEIYDGIDNTYDNGSHYSYDSHGNAVEIIQENKTVAHLLEQYKSLKYEFELISGNVVKVTYQDGQIDQFIHTYNYDADNRLFETYTSTDGVNFDKDGKYFYYEHGPMARVETGDKKVQAQDYFYTIHGWIKGMNSNAMLANTDPGKDASPTNAYFSFISGLHQYVAADAASYNLNYYNQGTNTDYSPIKNHNTTNDNNPILSINNLTGAATGINLGTDAPNLFNGNISSMVTGIINKDATVKDEASGNILPINQAFPQLAAYRYDQLHRIDQMKTFRSYNGHLNSWNLPNTNTYNDSYLNQFTYDPNGNIMSQLKNGASPTLRIGSSLNMDNLSYSYYGLPLKRTNQLICVGDNPTYKNNYSEDIDDELAYCAANPLGGYLSTNYVYDQIGNLIADSSECINTINWTVDRKMRAVIRDINQLKIQSKTLSDLEYIYDGNRRRICKIVKPRDVTSKALLDQTNWAYTYYVYDASGNVIATYQRKFTFSGGGFVDNYDLQEFDIYGSKRLGLIHDDNGVISSIPFTATINHNQFTNIVYGNVNFVEPDRSKTERDLGKKEYELTNHLGNVITTVSDRKLQDNYSADVGANNIVDYYSPEILSNSDYSPFGQSMPGRQYTAVSGYRYGFNDQEKDNEVNGGAYSAEYWEYDARLGRRWGIDPIVNPWESPYATFDNNPIYFADPSGLEGEGAAAAASEGGKSGGGMEGDPNKGAASNKEFASSYKFIKPKLKGKGGAAENIAPIQCKLPEIQLAEGSLKTPMNNAPPVEAKISQAQPRFVDNAHNFIFNVLPITRPVDAVFAKMAYSILNDFKITFSLLKNSRFDVTDLRGYKVGYDQSQQASVLTLAGFASGPLGKGIGGINQGAQEIRYLYRAITPDDAANIQNGLGIFAKNPSGAWSLEEHIVKGSSKAATKNTPWISTTTDIEIASHFNSGNGIVQIDLGSLNPNNVMFSYLKFTKQSPAYHFSVWQKEVTIFQHIPQNAIKIIK